MSKTFGREVRLRTRAQFTAVQDHGRRVSSRYVTLLAKTNDLGRDRLGIIASRRVGSAVMRNRAKRRLREIFRQEQPDVSSAAQPSIDVVAIARAYGFHAEKVTETGQFPTAFWFEDNSDSKVEGSDIYVKGDYKGFEMSNYRHDDDGYPFGSSVDDRDFADDNVLTGNVFSPPASRAIRNDGQNNRITP